jgi:flavin-dependent dehydrogenase
VRTDAAFDVAVLGAGPAGTGVALKLIALGYRVALIERLPFPRPQVGEALSPGVWNFLSLLDPEAEAEARSCTLVDHLPARVAWEGREPRLIRAEDRGPFAMVDRGAFDARLSGLAERRGATLFQPARLRRQDGEPGNWALQVAGPRGDLALRARLIVDARGRRARPPADCSVSGPPTLAAWTHIDADLFPGEARVEAIDRAWLWGAPAAEGRYRVMAFFDPSSWSRGPGSEAFLRGLFADGGLFKTAARSRFASPVFVRAATSYLDSDPWRHAGVRVGELALALDPLSSTGVEKSLRGAIQAAIAIHTALRDPADAALARAFYADGLADSAARHARWTRAHYRRAWPGPGHAFWRDRATGPEGDDHGEGTGDGWTPEVPADGGVGAVLASMASGVRFRLSANTSLVSTPCVVDDRVQLREAIRHPRLDGSVAFLADIEVVPLLRRAIATAPLPPEQLLALWSQVLSPGAALRLFLWLLRHDILTPDAMWLPSVPFEPSSDPQSAPELRRTERQPGGAAGHRDAAECP